MDRTRNSPPLDRSHFERYIGRIAIDCFFQSEDSHNMAANIRDLTQLLMEANNATLAIQGKEPGLMVIIQMMNHFLKNLVIKSYEE